MLRGGDYACLAQRVDSTGRRDTGVALPLLDLPKHKTWKITINHHTCFANAMHKHMMT